MKDYLELPKTYINIKELIKPTPNSSSNLEKD
jgi:hypothetical protein